MNPFRLLAGLALAGLCAVAVTGCDDDVPSDAVAKVGDTVITKQQFDRWYETAARSQAQAGGPAIVPDPPNYTKCVAAIKKALPKGTPQQSDAALEKQCKTNYEQLKQQVMQFQSQAEWVKQEAADQDIEISDAELQRMFEDQKKQAFPKEKAYRQFLRRTGATEADIVYRVKLDALQGKLAEKVQKDEGKVTDEDIEEYYE